MPRIHRGSGKVKNWKSKVYCLHGNCQSNTRELKPDVLMIPFIKPCKKFYMSLVDPVSFPHNPKQCEQCSSVLRWIHMCKRADKKVTICDITSRSYICSKHFYDLRGPSAEHPDPFPADMSEDAVNRTRAKIAKRLAVRISIEDKKAAIAAAAAVVVPEPDANISDLLAFEPRSDFRNETLRQGLAYGNVNHVESEQSGSFRKVVSSERITAMETVGECEVGAVQVVKVEGFEPDQHQSFCEAISMETVSLVLLKHGFTVAYDAKSCRVAINEGANVEFKPTLDSEIDVDGIRISTNHEVWSSIPSNLGVFTDHDAIVEHFRSLQQWTLCDVFKQARIVRGFQAALVEDVSESCEVRTVLVLAAKCRVLSREAKCAECREPIATLRRKLARLAKRKERKAYSMLHVKYMSKAEAHRSVRQLRHALALERRKVLRLKGLPDSGEGKAKEGRDSIKVQSDSRQLGS